MPPATRVVGIWPLPAKAERAGLFGALEHALAVRFEARRPGDWQGLDGLLVLGRDIDTSNVPCPVLIAESGDSASRAPGRVDFAEHAALDPVLRGQTLAESTLHQLAPLQPAPGDVVLAACGSTPVWLLRRGGGQARHVVATLAPELADTEVLRDRLRHGNFLGLLPLVQFLRDIEGDAGWTPPPLRAAFIFDDPNLHTSSYGYLSFPRLAEHAREHGYHVALASIPLDYSYVHPATARIFRDNAKYLSLAIHGNDHDRLELLRAGSADRALGVAGQALRRAAAFERRSELSVAKVMCPPHEVCSESMREALFRLGFEAISMARVVRPDNPHAPAARLGEWDPAQLVAGGLPILPRHMFHRSLDDIVLRAFLHHPLLLFGHHQDVARGLDPLARAAARINALGKVEWGSLTDICRTNFAVRRDASSLHVRLYARRVKVAIPAGIDELTIEVPPVGSTTGPVLAACNGVCAPVDPSEAEATAVSFQGPFPSSVELELRSTRALAAAHAPPPARRVWPILRRGLTESRDRTAPLRARIASSTSRILR